MSEPTSPQDQPTNIHSREYPPVQPPSVPPSFEAGLADILRQHRRNNAITDNQFIVIIAGYLHAYATRHDVRGAAAKTIALLLNTPNDADVDEIVRRVVGSILQVEFPGVAPAPETPAEPPALAPDP